MPVADAVIAASGVGPLDVALVARDGARRLKKLMIAYRWRIPVGAQRACKRGDVETLSWRGAIKSLRGDRS